MKKSIIVGFFVAAVALSALPVFAQTATPISVVASDSVRLEQLKSQLAALLKQVEESRKEIKELESRSPDFCFNFDATLSLGSRGSAVVALHKVLAREGFAVSSPEGQFDEETAAAVTGLQEKYRGEILTPSGLKFGTGVVGKGTRAKLQQLYACVKPPVGSLKVLSPNGGESWKLGSTQTITWQGSPELRVAPALYDVYLEYWYPPCKGAVCPMYSYLSPRAIAKNVSTNSIQWLVGDAIGDTNALNPGYYFIRVCESGGALKCDSSNDKFNIYDTPDTTSNKPPVIYGFEAPTQLKVGATGTWSVKASDPENGSLSYTIEWGDRAVDAPAGMMPYPVQESSKQQSSFTHAYSYPGEYKVIITVRDSAGATAQSSATTVVVAGEDPLIGKLKVRVLNGNIVCITTPCEFPLSGATVQVFDLSGTAILRSGVTDSEGYFMANDLKPYLSYPVRIANTYYVTQETNVTITPGSNSLVVRLQGYPVPLQQSQ
jgi:hypothetical protein